MAPRDTDAQSLAGWVRALAIGLVVLIFGTGVWVGRSSLTLETHAARLDAHDAAMQQTAQILFAIQERLGIQGGNISNLERAVYGQPTSDQ